MINYKYNAPPRIALMQASLLVTIFAHITSIFLFATSRYEKSSLLSCFVALSILSFVTCMFCLIFHEVCSTRKDENQERVKTLLLLLVGIEGGIEALREIQALKTVGASKQTDSTKTADASQQTDSTEPSKTATDVGIQTVGSKKSV